MLYLVKDGEGELVEILDSSRDNIEEYKKKNPEYSLTPSSETLDKLFEGDYFEY